MTTGALLGGIGGLAGAAIGIAGGLYGTYCSIRNTQTGPERRYMTGMGAGFYGVLWLLAGALTIAVVNIRAYPLAAGSALALVWLGYGLGLALFIRKANAAQRAIREGAAHTPITASVFAPAALGALAGQTLLVYSVATLSAPFALALAGILLAADAATAGLIRWGWTVPPA